MTKAQWMWMRASVTLMAAAATAMALIESAKREGR